MADKTLECVQRSIDWIRGLTKDVPARRRFVLLYTEFDGSICMAEGNTAMRAERTLYLLVGKDDEKERIADWMSTCKPGSVWIGWNRGKAAIVRTQ